MRICFTSDVDPDVRSLLLPVQQVQGCWSYIVFEAVCWAKTDARDESMRGNAPLSYFMLRLVSSLANSLTPPQVHVNYTARIHSFSTHNSRHSSVGGMLFSVFRAYPITYNNLDRCPCRTFSWLSLRGLLSSRLALQRPRSSSLTLSPSSSYACS